MIIKCSMVLLVVVLLAGCTTPGLFVKHPGSCDKACQERFIRQ